MPRRGAVPRPGHAAARTARPGHAAAAARPGHAAGAARRHRLRRVAQRGRPRILPAMMSRCTWDVPPAIPAALLHSHWRAHGPASAPDGSRPITMSAASEKPWVMAVHVSLIQLDSGPGSSPRPRRVNVRRLWSRSTPRSMYDPGQGVGDHGVVESAVAPGLLVEPSQIGLVDDLLFEGEVRPALVGQRRAGDGPALALRADHLVRRNEDVGEEDLVELGVAGHLHERAHVDTGIGHVDDERGDALLGPRFVRIGARQAQAPRGELGVGRPHLAAGHEVAPVRRHGTRRERGQVTPGIGLAEELAPDLGGGEDRWQVAPALLLGAVRQQGGADQVDPDPVQRLRSLRAGVLALVQRDLDGCGTPPSVGVRPVDTHPAVGGQGGLPGPAPGDLLGQVDEGGRTMFVGWPANPGTRRRTPRPPGSARGPPRSRRRDSTSPPR